MFCVLRTPCSNNNKRHHLTTRLLPLFIILAAADTHRRDPPTFTSFSSSIDRCSLASAVVLPSPPLQMFIIIALGRLLLTAPRSYRAVRRRYSFATSTLCASRSSSFAYFSACSAVASRNTGGATPASSASFQREAQRHQRSPGVRPGNEYWGAGVMRSLPRDLVNSKNSLVTWRRREGAVVDEQGWATQCSQI